MNQNIRLFITLALLLSFPTTNAVLFTPALPELATVFHVSVTTMETTFIWFLAGYCVGQLLYSPFNNRFGRRKTLFLGITVQIVSILISLCSVYVTSFNLLILSRFFLALGSGVGLMMTFALVSDVYSKERVPIIISYLMPAFAIVPALGVLLSSYLTTLYGSSASFYLSLGYGVIMMGLCSLLPTANRPCELTAFRLKNIISVFREQLCHKTLIIGGLLMGCCVALVYIFSTLVPFITTTYFHFDSVDYGIANGFSALGLLVGALIGTKLSHHLSNRWIIGLGVIINMIGSIGILLGEYFNCWAVISFFLPLFLINLGSCFVLAHASAMVLEQAQDKANASAVMSFINVGTTMLVMLLFSYLPLGHYLLALTFIGLSLVMLGLVRCCR